MSIELFQQWASPYTNHQQDCHFGCRPERPRCRAGFQIASRCISQGPIAWHRHNHDNHCPICRSGGFRCDKANQQIESFIEFLERHFSCQTAYPCT